MKANYTAKQAYEIAVQETNTALNAPKLVSVKLEDGYYHMIIRAAFLDYEVYVDSCTGEVAGLSTQPTDENDLDDRNYFNINLLTEQDEIQLKTSAYSLTAIIQRLRGLNRKIKMA